MKIIIGDACDEVIKLDNIQSIITSPPYYCQRDYGINNQIGLEDSVEEYINKLKIVFESCFNVLNNDGLVFVNIDDTYNYPRIKQARKWGKNKSDTFRPAIAKSDEVRVSSLFEVNEIFVLMMIKIGFIFKQRIIWHKENCMPESCKNRFTKDYEMIYMFSKSSNYKFNQLKEPRVSNDYSRPRGSKGSYTSNSGRRDNKGLEKSNYRNMRSIWKINHRNTNKNHSATWPSKLVERLVLCSTDAGDTILDPFAGTFTTCKVAKALNRKSVGIELNESYSI